jgi:hypothetical protein
MTAIPCIRRRPAAGISLRHTVAGSPGRAEAEEYVAQVFRDRYAAQVRQFAPNLLLVERDGDVSAAVGWRCAADERLFLESYLDLPVERLITRAAGHAVPRESVVEVGHLAAQRRGGSVDAILGLARHLDALGFEWVVFTATSELIRIFSRLSLPLFALAPADPARLGASARDWGSYYDTAPVVVAGRIRFALQGPGLAG